MTAESSKARTALVWLLLLAVLGVGAWLRFHRLGAKSVRLDEATAMAAIERPLGEVLFAPRRDDPQPPLYFAALRFWMAGSRSGVRARALSAAAGVASLVLLYALARLLLPRWAALVATGLAAASAFQVCFAQEARLHALAALFVTASWYLLAELLVGRRLERWPMWLGLAVSNAAALYTSCHAAFAVVAQLLVLLLVWREVGRKLVVPWLVWQLVPAAAFAFYMPVFLERAALRGSGLPAAASVVGVFWEAGRQFGGGFLHELAGRYGTSAGIAGAVVTVLVLMVGVAGARRCRAAMAVGLGWLVVPVIGLAALPVEFRGQACEAAEVLFAAPAVALLAAVGLTAMRGKLRAIPIAAVVLAVGLNVVSLVRYYDRGVEKEDWRGAIAWMTEHVKPGDIVCLRPARVRDPFDYYYRGPAVLRRDAPAEGAPLQAGDLRLERRTWIVTQHAGVGRATPEVDAVLAAYPVVAEQRFPALRGTIHLRLYDTRRPVPPKPEQPPGQPEKPPAAPSS